MNLPTWTRDAFFTPARRTVAMTVHVRTFTAWKRGNAVSPAAEVSRITTNLN